MTALFAALDATWPAAETAERAGWRLRRGAGGGRRLSAASALRPGADPAEAEAGLALWGQPPLFRVGADEAALDAALAARGLGVEAPSRFFAAEAAALLDDRSETARVIRGTGRVALMEEIWAGGGTGPARLAAMDRAAGPKAFLMARLGDRPAAVAFVACAGGVAMIHAIRTLPEMRRRGAARMLMAAAAGFAAERGAETLALAVEADNESAIRLYEALGMRDAGGYHYRVRQEGDST